MQATAELLSDADIDAVARHFSAQPLRAGTLVALGDEERRAAERLHRHGDPARGVPACRACHGANGEGQGNYPRLAGQHATYLEAQLYGFREGRRANDTDGIMRTAVSGASAHEIRLLARYYAGLGRP